MYIDKIHSFLVKPEKGRATLSPINAADVPQHGKMYEMLLDVAVNADKECKYDVAFAHNENGEQRNECKELICSYALSGNQADGLLIARRLQSLTTKRSGHGLLFLILGSKGNAKKLVISRFPADSGILAEETQTGLSIAFLEKIFMKSLKAYKCAVYEGTNIDADFWKGKAIDKQISSDITISDYWIREFLLSDFATTGARGSRRLANALKTAFNSTPSSELKEEIAAALKLLNNLDGEIVSAESFVRRFNLSKDAQVAIRSHIRPEAYQEQFRLVSEEFKHAIQFRSVELSNGAVLTSPSTTFNEVFKKNVKENGRIEFSTIGVVMDERVKKSR